jgi:excinuclease ABC subunit A
VPDETLSLKDGAIAPWSKATSTLYGQTLESLASTTNYR